MNLTLSNPELERHIDEQVKAGHFKSPEEIVEAALNEFFEREDELTEEDRAAISRADAQIERGEFVDFDEFAARMRKKYGIS